MKRNSRPMSRVLCFACAKCSSFIWMCRRRHILSFYPPTFLRRESNEPPSNVGLHELSASEVHGLPRHHGNRWALTPPSHPYRRAVRNLAPAVIFLLHEFAFTDDFPLRSGMPCAARTFLTHHTNAGDELSGCSFSACKSRKKSAYVGEFRGI